jgi:hypothetical protein
MSSVPTFALASPRAATNDDTPTFSGAGTDGDTITVRAGIVVIGTVVVASSAWSITAGAALAEGSYEFTCQATKDSSSEDAANTIALVIDTTAPVFNSSAVRMNNAIVTVTFSEPVFNANTGSGALAADDFVLSVAGGTAT